MRKNTRQTWADHCTELALTESDHYVGGVKSFARVTLSFPPLDSSLTLQDVGYSATNNKKFTSICHHYKNQDSLDYAAKHIQKHRHKKDWQVGLSLQGSRKTYSKQDYCMQSLVITSKKGLIEIDVFHRNTEVIKKFAADLVFVKHLLDELDITEYQEIHFHLVNVNISAIFYPVLVAHQEDKDWEVLLFDGVRKTDLRFYKNVVRWGHNLIQKEPINYKSIRRVQESLPRIMSKTTLIQFKKFIKKEYKK